MDQLPPLQGCNADPRLHHVAVLRLRRLYDVTPRLQASASAAARPPCCGECLHSLSLALVRFRPPS